MEALLTIAGQLECKRLLRTGHSGRIDRDPGLRYAGRTCLEGVELTAGSGVLPLRSFTDAETGEERQGLAGSIDGRIEVGITGVTFEGELTLEINQTPEAITEVFTFAGETISLSLDAGSYIKFAGEGLSLTVFEQTITGDFSFIQFPDFTALTLSGANLSLLGGLFDISIDTGLIMIFRRGFSRTSGLGIWISESRESRS